MSSPARAASGCACIDGDIFDAKLIGGDAKTDLALLKIDAGRPLPFVEFGDSDRIRAGDWVMTIGNPFGLGGSVTAGIVSARGRDLHGGSLVDFMQIDAPINQGSSGGPAFDAEGKGDRRQRLDLFAQWWQCRDRLRHPVQRRQAGDRRAQGRRQDRARLARGAESSRSPRMSPRASA